MADTDPKEPSSERAPRRRRRSTSGVSDTQTPPIPSSEPKPEAKAPGKPIGTLQKKLEQFLVGLGLPFAAAGDMHCAMIFAHRGPVVAEAWSNLAAESPAVKRVLESMLRGGAWAGALGSTLALVMAVGSHHGLPVPDVSELFGMKQPEPVPAQSNGHTEPESIVFTAPQEGPAVPGPAAVSIPDSPPSGENDPTDPANYPGLHNSTDS